MKIILFLICFFSFVNFAESHSFLLENVKKEFRCSKYDRSAYSYPANIEAQIVVNQGGRAFAPYSKRWVEDLGHTDIEHIVSLAEAHDSGLCSAPADVRRAFSRDLANLTLAYPKVNRWQKSSKDAGEWLPDYNSCWYVWTIIGVKQKYDLSFDALEAQSLLDTVASCTNFSMVFPVVPVRDMIHR